ncbi:Bystin-domain-containing protein [Pestalotiopsis sp. NC0098]|nr:Bystin-domain-containing protein [Pestalotiopsis sp. NC0098]
MPKATTPKASQGRRHNPLADDLLATGGILKNKAPKRQGKGGDEDAEAYVDAKASQQILKLGRELADEHDAAPARPPTESNAFGFESRFPEEEEVGPFDNDDEAWGDDDEVVEEIEVEPEDLETYQKFLGAEDDPLSAHEFFGGQAQDSSFAAGGSRNLADIILSKIAAHEAGEARAQGAGPVDDDDYELPPKVVEVYTKIGMIMSRYKSGKLPKPLKILPTIPHWEDILMVTKPEDWTANAVYEATRIFVSGKPLVAQRFVEMVLLDKVREDVYENKKLNVHLFAALKKSLYKPAAFFKGFLFPLVSSGTCTLLEARIVSAVLVRVHIPVLHSAAAIKGLCDIAAEEASAGTEGGGATNIFIKALLEKRYALPFQVIDGLVFHFLRMRSMDPASMQKADMMDVGEERAATQAKLPVIYHQCLLMFAERYRNDITEDQREALLDLLLTHGHHKIGPEIRRELLAGRGRGVQLEPQGPALDNDDTMMAID